MTATAKDSNIVAIRDFFQRVDGIAPTGGRKVTMQEFKDLSGEERQELADLARVELGL